MKSKLLILITFLLFIQHNTFAQIDKKELLEYSLGVIKIQKLNSNKNLTPSNVVELKDENNSTTSYVVNLKPKGFIVFSASKNLLPVISFSTESDFDYKISDKNILLEMIKTDAKKELNILSEKIDNKKKKQVLLNNQSWKKLKNASFNNSESIARASTTSTLIQHGAHFSNIWGGVNCYNQNGQSINVGNYYTPNNYSPGCVATTLSMVLRYYKWPETGIGSHTNYDDQGSSQTSWTSNFGNATYDYDNMLDEYLNTSSTLIQQKAMGYLAFHAATAVDMDYEYDGSTSNIDKIPDAANSYFRFSGHYETSSWSSFWARLRENLENEHPVPLSIYTTSGAGHAPACDGYRYNEGDSSSEYYYHLNMGWWGSNNAWYRLQGSFNAGGYSSVTGAVFDMLPDPIFSNVNESPNSKTFNLSWKTSNKLNWDAFELQESYEGGTFVTVSNNIIDTTYTRTVTSGGTYQYRVRAKTDGNFYSNSYSEEIEINIPYDLNYLDFDENDSFFVNDNSNNDLDISDTYTIETWVKVDSRTSNTYPVILDRKTVFSLYLIADSNADYAVKFVARDTSGNIIADIQSDLSSMNLSFGEWVHIAITRSSGTTKLYLDGVEVDNSTNSSFLLSASTNALNIGARYWGTYERYLDGAIDKIRISNISRYSNNFVPGFNEKYYTDNNTALLLNLDEGIGVDLTDDAINFSSITLRDSPNQPNWINSDEVLEFAKTLSTSEEKLDILKLYPIPTKNTLFCFLNNTILEDVKKVTIYNYLGKSIVPLSVTFEKKSNKIAIDVSNIKTGYYIIQVETKSQLIKSKFIKN